MARSDELLSSPGQNGSEMYCSNLPRRSVARWLAAVGIFACCLGTAIMPWDRQLSQMVRQADLPGDVRKAINLSEAFAHGSGCAAILLALYLSDIANRRALWVAMAMTSASGLAANGLKAAFVRLRPHAIEDGAFHSDASLTAIDFWGDGSFWTASERSFPSGHSATAWGLAIGLAAVYPRAWPVFAVLAVLASMQRIFAGAHYPSDVLVGAAIACVLCGSIVATPWARRLLQRDSAAEEKG